jgi:hypothetical protein
MMVILVTRFMFGTTSSSATTRLKDHSHLNDGKVRIYNSGLIDKIFARLDDIFENLLVQQIGHNQESIALKALMLFLREHPRGRVDACSGRPRARVMTRCIRTETPMCGSGDFEVRLRRRLGGPVPISKSERFVLHLVANAIVFFQCRYILTACSVTCSGRGGP